MDSYEQIRAWDDAGEYCYIHGHEPAGDYQYLICGECFHCYPTPEDLLNDFNRIMKEGNDKWGDGEFVPATSVDQIFFCAHCVHDF